MLSERIVIDKIEILEDGQIQVRQATVIERDGVELTRTFHRWVHAPGDDIKAADPRVLAVARAIWTPDVVAAHRAAVAKVEAKTRG